MTGNRESRNKIEILAPAGSYESFRAAVLAGADAVYAGGPCFGARAFADNFTEEQLLDAIAFAHLHGRRLYLTVNTLVKDDEMDRLYSYLKPLYHAGLDAVIVQDVGVLFLIKEHFPDMEIHASTQMTITNVLGARFLKEQGVCRVVPARELSLEEVREITKEDIEVECFVHGALCYCYSGQCLLSSMIGGRSGNRGQCAQPCRQPYTTKDKKGYLLSLKDICTLQQIPQLIEAGIDSFKIEGRMKKPEYVSLVTSLYRKYVDLYMEKGKNGFSVSAQDKERLLDIYNRGGFSEGYYEQQNGANMISLDRPNHAGVAAVRICGQKGRTFVVEALTKISKGDILELPGATGKMANYTFGSDLAKGERLEILLSKGMTYSRGTVLNRIRNQALLNEIQEQLASGVLQQAVCGFFFASPNKPAALTVTKGDKSFTAVATEVVEEAKNQPMETERIKRQLEKTGNSEFFFETLQIQIEGNVFLPMRQINELRREALEGLTGEICGFYKRGTPEKISLEKQDETSEIKSAADNHDKKPPFVSVLVQTKEQAEVAFANPLVSRIYLECNLWNILEEPLFELQCVQENNFVQKEIFLALPHIFRTEAAAYLEKNYNLLKAARVTGVLIRNYESFYFLKKHGFDKKIILDHNLYVMNQKAKCFWKNNAVFDFTAPLELNKSELGRLGLTESELVVYGKIPVMISAQCIQKTISGCTKKTGFTQMEDRYQNVYPVWNCCDFCYNIVYDTKPLYLMDLKQELCQLSAAGLRILFTTESQGEAKQILQQMETLQNDFNTEQAVFTRGHFNRGIT